MMNAFDHHCLYFYYEGATLDSHILIPFCIRPETQKKSNDENKLCYGESITFEKLKLININIADLFKWNAVIEIIDLYEKYLLLPDLINDNESYCNCSFLLQFGKSCEYKFNYYDNNDEQSFTQLFTKKDNLIDDEIRNQYMTYYIGIQCQTNLLYLDWRQICNGIVDCDHGEDEPFELCLEMELNQCDNETEFRCKNGLCMPMSFGYDTNEDCPDRSDGVEIYQSYYIEKILTECSSCLNFECDEYNLGWKQFSCGNGQFIPYSNLTSRIYIMGENKYYFKYLTKLFYSNNENECWKSMICLTGFDYLYSNINCLNETIEINIKQYCPNEYYFPSNSVIYSFVFFLYENSNHTKWFNYTGPNYICYKKEYCEKNISLLSTILKNNLTCFYVNQTLFSWKNFYEYITYLFSSCYSTSLIINDKMLYKCNLSDTFISIYRVKDRKKDCFFNEDEDLNINLCLFNTNDQFKCLKNENECIRQPFVRDQQYDCSDGSDEYYENKIYFCLPMKCFIYYQYSHNIDQTYRFEELCDNIVNPHLFSIGSNETDETDCEYWPFTCYNSPFTRCDDIWNCENGHDEMNCSIEADNDVIRNSFSCNNNENYCIQLINNNNDINMTCININRTGDGIIDCIGGTDERLTNICTEKYPIYYEQRFYCMNSSICIKRDQVCDTIIDCPYEDDERICSWLFKSNSSRFYCQNSPLYSIDRCHGFLEAKLECHLQEHLWFCDLGRSRRIMTAVIQFEEYPTIGENIRSLSFESIEDNKLLLSKKRTLSLINTNIDMLLCNNGYPIQSLISSNKSYCLCSPSYYGDHCQYQSERLTVLIKLRIRYDIDPLTVFRLIIYLLDDNNTIISHDEIVYNRRSGEDDWLDRFLVYLIDKRMINISLNQRSKSKFVRIDLYIIKETNIQYRSSWLFHVSFPFLPVNKLITELVLENESFKIWKCQKTCGLHGKCMYYVNSKSTEYCWCNQGWVGEKCHLKSSSNLCNQTSCGSHSQCVILNDEKKQIKCICPLGKSGNQCYIKYNSCYNALCQNNGTCLPLDQRNFRYNCICNDDYTGDHCEYPKMFSYISIPTNISDLSTIPVIIVIITSLGDNVLQGGVRRMYKNILLPATLRKDIYDSFEFIRIFYNSSKSSYYLVTVQPLWNQQVNTSVISRNLCKNVSEIFNETILYKYSYLKRLKLYHLPCQQNKDLRCFFDEYRMCLCTQNNFSSCYLFYPEFHDCDYCQNDGLCVREGSGEQRWNYVCLCPKCSFGHRCQFTSGNYFITLDMLIGIEMKTDVSFNQQSFIIYLILIILISILIISFIFNIISIIIFSNKKLRKVGCDLYLLYLTIISQIGLVLLFLRYLYTITTQIYITENDLFIKISCIFLEYSLRLIPSLFDWLTVCISIERTYTVIKDIQFTKALALKTLKISHGIIFIVFILNILTTLHRPFYLVLTDTPTLNSEISGHLWCVLNFQSTSWNIYEKSINIIHLVLPLILNLLSIILFLLRKTKSESTTTIRIKAEISIFVIFKEQLLKYKPLLISTIMIIILEIPRFVLTFALVCIEHTWQRYVHLTGYIISFLPLTGILFIYVIPSPKYKEQFRKIMKKAFRRSFFRNAER